MTATHEEALLPRWAQVESNHPRQDDQSCCSIGMPKNLPSPSSRVLTRPQYFSRRRFNWVGECSPRRVCCGSARHIYHPAEGRCSSLRAVTVPILRSESPQSPFSALLQVVMPATLWPFRLRHRWGPLDQVFPPRRSQARSIGSGSFR